VREWRRHNNRLTSPDELVQSMFALSRAVTDDGPLQIYLAISALESRRSPEHRLAPATVRLLAQKFDKFSDQYRIFSEFQELNDTSIILFLNTAEALETVPNAVRGNALGVFQANVGIWQILARQGEIPGERLNDSWLEVIKPFAKSDRRLRCITQGALLLENCFDLPMARREFLRMKSSSCWRAHARRPRKE